MEFNSKLQELRKQKGMTQQQLADALFVSRTAVSKWESGRGYPSIDSLRAISLVFDITLDELLSGEQLLTLAEKDTKQKEARTRDLLFGSLDVSASMLFVLPLFGERTEEAIRALSLIELVDISPYLSVGYYTVVIGMILTGLLTLALQSCNLPLWVAIKGKLSLLLSTAAVLLFVISLQPYAAVLTFILLSVKVILTQKIK